MSRSDRTVSVRGRGPEADRLALDTVGNQASPSFLDMQRRMADELERRRLEWEKEVERMQEDFFKVKVQNGAQQPKQLQLTADPASLRPSDTSAIEIFDISNTKTLYHELPDGSRVFKMRFDVREFSPEEINVRAEGRKLIVSAKHTEGVTGQGKTSKQLNRQVDIPDDVWPEKIVSYLSSDGILTVEAPAGPRDADSRRALPDTATPLGSSSRINSSPTSSEQLKTSWTPTAATMNSGGSPSQHWQSVSRTKPITQAEPQRPLPPEYDSVVRQNQSPRVVAVRRHSPPNRVIDTSFRTISPPASDDQSQSNAAAFRHLQGVINAGGQGNDGMNTDMMLRQAQGSSHQPFVVDTEYGRKLRISVELGRDNYRPDQVVVRLSVRKLHITARSEVVNGGRSSSREFTRDFDLPDLVEGNTLRALLDPRDGRLYIGASMASNENHELVLNSVLNDIPLSAKLCTVQLN